MNSFFLLIEQVLDLSRLNVCEGRRLSEAGEERLLDLVDVAHNHRREVDLLKENGNGRCELLQGCTKRLFASCVNME